MKRGGLILQRPRAHTGPVSVIVADYGLHQLHGCIQLPRVQMSVAQPSFADNGPAVCNSLSATVQDSSVSLHTFKWRLKTHLFAAR